MMTGRPERQGAGGAVANPSMCPVAPIMVTLRAATRDKSHHKNKQPLYQTVGHK
jgi:hypothetical protein